MMALQFQQFHFKNIYAAVKRKENITISSPVFKVSFPADAVTTFHVV